MSSNKLCIPIINDKLDVNIFLDELKDTDFNDIIDILRAELAPLHTWRICAVRLQ
jgi:hypothetical protein